MIRRIMDRKGGWIALSLLAVALFVLVNVAAGRVVGLRADLTEDNLYSLSEGTRNILHKLEKPVELTLYYSDALGTAAPAYGNYAVRVKDMLRVIESTGGDKVTLEIKDPKPFSEVEDKAVELGMQGVPVDETGAKVYFGLAAKSGDKEIVIPFFQLERERFLEYDIASLILNLGTKGKPVLAVYSVRPMFGDFQMQMRGLPATPWAIVQQLQNYVEVKQIFDLEEIWEHKPDVLMLVHPAALEPQDYYDIDQYLLRGGKAIVFLDPFNESAAARKHSQFPERVTSDLSRLLDHWGIQMVKDRVVGDRRYARMVNAGDEKQIIPAPYLTWLALREDALSQSDAVTSQISLLHLQSAGILQKAKEDSALAFEPLLTSSPDSQQIDVAMLEGEQPKILAMVENFQPSGERMVMSARLNGRAKTMFPDGPPKEDEEEKKQEGAKGDEKPDEKAGETTGAPAGEEKPAPEQQVKADRAERAKAPAAVAQTETAPAEKPAESPPAEKEAAPAEDAPAAKPGEPAAAEKKQEEKPARPPHIAESTAPMNVILVADTDMLEDRSWVQVREFFGQRVQVPFANNADFVVNAVENLAGGDDLIGLRSRGTAQRPFTKIAELRLEADRRFRAEEQRLRKKLEEAEKNLAELQKKKAEGAGDTTVDEALQATAAKFTEEVLSTRKALRQVQLALREDIESLETRLRFVNIALIPILVGVLAVALGVWRIRRRKARTDMAKG